jgi:choline dehydrogenase-like flavoprotein
VGAGAAGIVLSRALAARGVDVVLVESGGVEAAASTDGLDHGASTGQPYRYLSGGRARMLGGTTTKWAGQCLAMRPGDLAPRPWIPHSGWPIDYRQLAPHLFEAAKILAVDRRKPLRTVHASRGLAPLSFDAQACETITTVYTPNLDFGRHFRADIQQSTRIRCVLHAAVVGLGRDRDRRHVENVTISTPEGRRATISATAVVLCAGPIENARLLLAAYDDGVAPGNAHDQVGRYLQDHPSAITTELSSDDPRRLLAYLDLVSLEGLRYWPKLATTSYTERRHEIAAASAALDINWGNADAVAAGRVVTGRVRCRRLPTVAHVSRASRHLVGIGAAAYRNIGHARGWPLARPQRIGLRVQIEQAPNPASRVTLSRERDSLGVPRVEVQWRLSSLDRRTFAKATVLFTAALYDQGLARGTAFWDMSSDRLPAHVDEAYHPAGTTRMSRDERDGVVDSNLTVHGTSNLFVCGSSVFPTAGYANPTQTLCALALRLAGHLSHADSVVRRRITASAP